MQEDDIRLSFYINITFFILIILANQGYCNKYFNVFCLCHTVTYFIFCQWCLNLTYEDSNKLSNPAGF